MLALVLLLIGAFMGNPPVSAKTATNFLGFDLAQAFTDLTKSRIGGLGLNIMAIGGFSFYMNKIGASTALVKLCVRPLSAIHSPYVLLGLTYVVGQCMALFINSAVGLGFVADGFCLSAARSAGRASRCRRCRDRFYLLLGSGSEFVQRPCALPTLSIPT